MQSRRRLVVHLAKRRDSRCGRERTTSKLKRSHQRLGRHLRSSINGANKPRARSCSPSSTSAGAR